MADHITARLLGAEDDKRLGPQHAFDMWSAGTGSEVMQRIAVPMIGGMISSTILTLIVIPAIYGLIKGWKLPSPVQESESAPLADSRIAAE